MNRSGQEEEPLLGSFITAGLIQDKAAVRMLESMTGLMLVATSISARACVHRWDSERC